LDEVMALDRGERNPFALQEVNQCLAALAQPHTNISRNLLKRFIARISWLVGGVKGIHFRFCICGAELSRKPVAELNHPHLYNCPLLADHFKSEFGDFDSTVAAAKARRFILLIPSTIALSFLKYIFILFCFIVRM
jgi:hypothetical protein